MLIEFSFSNYRSFRGENTLSLESLIKKKESLPLVAIYGKNGGGKSNLIRAFWLAVKFICNAQMTQGAGAPVPVDPFKLNDYSTETPTSFEFIYKYNGIKYIYGFSATNIFFIIPRVLRLKFLKGRDKNFLSFKIRRSSN